MARNACTGKLGILSIKNRSFPYNNLGLLNVYKLNKENNSKDLNNAENGVFKGYILFFQILEELILQFLQRYRILSLVPMLSLALKNYLNVL